MNSSDFLKGIYGIVSGLLILLSLFLGFLAFLDTAFSGQGSLLIIIPALMLINGICMVVIANKNKFNRFNVISLFLMIVLVLVHLYEWNMGGAEGLVYGISMSLSMAIPLILNIISAYKK